MVKIPETYELISDEMIEDVHAEGILLRHRKSGAHVALLVNDDDNKVFNIAFRTPPADSTGVAHIIEHTVLCGSRKFPLKDPFVELAKGSLNTFLNAMTFPDKTMYPVASTNDKDFQNLMDVYLDAVFYPNIYKTEKIFRQEGWHYDLESADAPLKYNGVVYNEMKGAFSSSEEILGRAMCNALFPDTPYGVESGGDPAVIPELTYEQFLNFHRRYYHPSNSYIYLYGNMDMAEKLEWIDAEYLSHFDRIDVDSSIPEQKPFPRIRELEMTYPILEEEPLEDNTYLQRSVVTGNAMEVEKGVALSVLDYVLLSSPGAPVKQALLDAGIGKDVDGSYDDGILQPFFTVTARNANAEDKERFVQVIEDTLRKIAGEGVSRKALESGINYYEFRFREADYSNYPKGLIYGIDLFESWLYDENKPFEYLRELQIFEDLKKKIPEGYFEELIRTCLLDNPHGAVIVLSPERGLAQKKDRELADKLAAYKASLTKEEIDALVQDTRDLKAYQEEQDSEEVIEKLPMLSRGDIAEKTPVRLSSIPHKSGDTLLLQHDFFTNGIGYLTLLFDAEEVPDDLIPYLGLLRSVLGYISTEHYSYGELFHEINANTGGISCGLQVFPAKDGNGKFLRKFGVQAKYLYPKQKFVFDMIREILLTSKLDDAKRMREILASTRARLQVSIPAAGHASAVRRVLSYTSPMNAWQERTDGIDWFHFIEELDTHFEDHFDETVAKLTELSHILFRPENLSVSLTCDADGWAGLEENVEALKRALYTDEVRNGSCEWKESVRNEGWITSGQVQFVASGGDFKKSGGTYTGALRVLRVILNYGYLWMNLRVKGGAYGCMSGFSRNGAVYMTSYRDPNLKNTLDVYRALPDYIASFRADEREMTKYIIGAISDLDTPLTPSAKGSVSMNAYYTGLTEADFQKERDEILKAEDGDIRALKELVVPAARCSQVCVIGSASVIERDRECLKEIRPLVSGGENA